jgi:hypothetical protein
MQDWDNQIDDARKLVIDILDQNTDYNEFDYIVFHDLLKVILGHGLSPTLAVNDARRKGPCWIYSVLHAGTRGRMIWDKQLSLDEARAAMGA